MSPLLRKNIRVHVTSWLQPSISCSNKISDHYWVYRLALVPNHTIMSSIIHAENALANTPTSSLNQHQYQRPLSHFHLPTHSFSPTFQALSQPKLNPSRYHTSSQPMSHHPYLIPSPLPPTLQPLPRPRPQAHLQSVLATQ